MIEENKELAGRPANVDRKVAQGFGDEWVTFRQSSDDLSPAERSKIFEGYFNIFPWSRMPAKGGIGIDVGCGSGRWAALVAPRVAHLHVLDASDAALSVARENLSSMKNVSYHLATIEDAEIPDGSLDFAYSLGVLHHVPDTQQAICAIAAKLKGGSPFLIYLYYAMENRPTWFRALWHLSNFIRLIISRAPHPIRLFVSQGIAIFAYWPMARFARILEIFNLDPSLLPLSWYRDKSFYVMQTDSYDRFCTRLEKRFTKTQINEMLLQAGFTDTAFSKDEPYWCAVGIKKQT